MPDGGWPIEPVVSRTCSTTRLITLRLGWVAIDGAFAAFFVVRLRAAFLGAAFFAAAFFGAERFLLVRFAEALREPARRFEDFFDDRERFDEDFVERLREEDRLLDAMGFLLFIKTSERTNVDET
jgi:hypothetical protein